MLKYANLQSLYLKSQLSLMRICIIVLNKVKCGLNDDATG